MRRSEQTIDHYARELHLFAAALPEGAVIIDADRTTTETFIVDCTQSEDRSTTRGAQPGTEDRGAGRL